MLTGSTSALASLPVLSSRLPCRILHRHAFFTRSLVLLPGRRISTASHCSQSALEGRSHNAFARSDSLPFHPDGTPSIRPHVFPAFADAKRVHRPVGADPLSDAQRHQPYARVLNLADPRDQSERKCTARRRRTLLWIMLTAKSPDRAWPAYQELLSYRAVIPHHSLHQLARLLASIKPRTRTVHLQLLSVLKTLQRNHGRLRLWEWNTLIDSVGKQWHKTRLEDYENALDIFDKRGLLPLVNAASTSEVVDAAADLRVTRQNPDVWTYNILLSIASRSNLPLAVRHASSLLLASELPPNRYTHLCLLRYFAVRKDLDSVRSTLHKMTQQGLEIGLDGINACLWAYARNGRFDVALRIYRLLRSRVLSMSTELDDDVDEDVRYVRDTVGLDLPDGLAPDAITYTTLIQSLAYHGDLKNALGVFVDMLSTTDRDARTHDNAVPKRYKPSMAAFRGLFLGFARHGRNLECRETDSETIAALFPSSHGSWDLDTLETVFAAFLQLPSLPKPTERVIYWIIVGFDKTSGCDVVKLREVWTKLETKYGGGWGGRLADIRKTLFAPGGA